MCALSLGSTQRMFCGPSGSTSFSRTLHRHTRSHLRSCPFLDLGFAHGATVETNRRESKVYMECWSASENAVATSQRLSQYIRETQWRASLHTPTGSRQVMRCFQASLGRRERLPRDTRAKLHENAR